MVVDTILSTISSPDKYLFFIVIVNEPSTFIVKNKEDNFVYFFHLSKENELKYVLKYTVVVSGIIIFSEIHRFDRTLWNLKEAFRKINKWTFSKIFGWKLYFLFENLLNTVLFKSKFYKIKEKDIKKINNNDKRYLEKQNFLNDGSGFFQLYDISNLFGVKRVEREYDNRIRKYIRKLMKGL